MFVMFEKWLEATFLKYLDDWEKSAERESKEKKLSKTAKCNMLLSEVTRTGLKFTGKIWCVLL